MKRYGAALLVLFSWSLHGMDWLGALEHLYYFPCVEKFNELVHKDAIPAGQDNDILQDRDAWGDSLLVYAIKARNKSLVQNIINSPEGSALLNAQNCVGNTPLHEAITQLGKIEPTEVETMNTIIDVLLDNEHLQFLPNDNDYDPLEFACVGKQWSLCKNIVARSCCKLPNEEKKLWKSLVEIEEQLSRSPMETLSNIDQLALIWGKTSAMNQLILNWILRCGSILHVMLFLNQADKTHFADGFACAEDHPLNKALAIGAYDKAKLLLDTGIFLRDARGAVLLSIPSCFNLTHLYKLWSNRDYKEFWTSVAHKGKGREIPAE